MTPLEFRARSHGWYQLAAKLAVARALQHHVTVAAARLAELSDFPAKDEALQTLLAMTDYLVGARDGEAELVRRATRLLRGGPPHADATDDANRFRVVDAFLRSKFRNEPLAKVRALLVESDPRLKKASDDAIRVAVERYAGNKSRAGTLADLYAVVWPKERRTSLHQRIDSALGAKPKNR